MAKNKGKRRRGFGFAQVAKFARLAAFVAPAAGVALSSGTPQEKVKRGIRFYTGFNMDTGTFSFQDLIVGWAPGVATSAITYGISKINGMIRRI